MYLSPLQRAGLKLCLLPVKAPLKAAAPAVVSKIAAPAYCWHRCAGLVRTAPAPTPVHCAGDSPERQISAPGPSSQYLFFKVIGREPLILLRTCRRKVHRFLPCRLGPRPLSCLRIEFSQVQIGFIGLVSPV